MNRRPTSTVFLEQRSYRRRRAMDALRLLPILGLMLWLLPVFWPKGDATGQAVSTSTAVTYVFAIWVLLITVSFALWLGLRKSITEDGAGEEER